MIVPLYPDTTFVNVDDLREGADERAVARLRQYKNYHFAKGAVEEEEVMEATRTLLVFRNGALLVQDGVSPETDLFEYIDEGIFVVRRTELYRKGTAGPYAVFEEPGP